MLTPQCRECGQDITILADIHDPFATMPEQFSAPTIPSPICPDCLHTLAELDPNNPQIIRWLSRYANLQQIMEDYKQVLENYKQAIEPFKEPEEKIISERVKQYHETSEESRPRFIQEFEKELDEAVKGRINDLSRQRILTTFLKRL